jgi:hypothetical protein
MVLALPAAEQAIGPEETEATQLADRAIVERLHRRPRTGEGSR